MLALAKSPPARLKSSLPRRLGRDCKMGESECRPARQAPDPCAGRSPGPSADAESRQAAWGRSSRSPACPSCSSSLPPNHLAPSTALPLSDYSHHALLDDPPQRRPRHPGDRLWQLEARQRPAGRSPRPPPASHPSPLPLGSAAWTASSRWKQRPGQADTPHFRHLKVSDQVEQALDVGFEHIDTAQVGSLTPDHAWAATQRTA
jgi:hypothetical protein